MALRKALTRRGLPTYKLLESKKKWLIGLPACQSKLYARKLASEAIVLANFLKSGNMTISHRSQLTTKLMGSDCRGALMDCQRAKKTARTNFARQIVRVTELG